MKKPKSVKKQVDYQIWIQAMKQVNPNFRSQVQRQIEWAVEASVWFQVGDQVLEELNEK